MKVTKGERWRSTSCVLICDGCSLRQLEELHHQQTTFSQDMQKAKDDLRLAQERFSRESELLSSSHQQVLEDLQTKIKQLVRIYMSSFTACYLLQHYFQAFSVSSF